MQTNPAAEQNKNIRRSESPWNESIHFHLIIIIVIYTYLPCLKVVTSEATFFVCSVRCYSRDLWCGAEVVNNFWWCRPTLCLKLFGVPGTFLRASRVNTPQTSAVLDGPV